MAVFGILILIVIYLLINAKVSDIEFVEALETMREEKATLGDSVVKAEVQRQELFEKAVKVVESRSAQELNKQVEANQDQIETYERTISSLLADVETKAEDLNKTIAERFETHPGVLSTRREVVEKQAELDALKDALETTKLEAEKTEDVIQKTESYMADIQNQFRVELDQSLAGESVYLVDFGGRQIRAYKVVNGEQSDVPSATAADLLSRVKTDSGKKRVFFFVRPDAVKEFNEALVAFRDSKIAVGYQPVPNGEKLILTKFPDGVPYAEEPQTSGAGSTGGEQSGSGASGVAAGGSGSGAEGGGGSEATGGSSGSGAPQGNETSSSGAASGGQSGAESGAASTEGGSQEGDSSSSAESASGSGQADDSGVEPPVEVVQTFNWLLLIFLLLLLIIIILVVKSSKR